jgi:putative exosortase-associated protein (TIGR04073 family)
MSNRSCQEAKTGRGRLVRASILLGLLAVVAVPSAAPAQSAARKAGRGLAAMTTSWLEVPGQMVAESRSRGNAEGLPLGFVKGLGGIVVRTLVGVYEFVTCPFAVPAGFAPIIQPEFPWSYFDDPEPRRHS